MADVVVIGGGILGATAALHLADAGAGEVVLLEREPALGTQTTAAGAGFVGYWAGELEAELAGYGMRFYADLRDRSGGDLGVRQVGLLFPALSEPGDRTGRTPPHTTSGPPGRAGSITGRARVGIRAHPGSRG